MKRTAFLTCCLSLVSGLALGQVRGGDDRAVAAMDALPGGAGSHAIPLSEVPPNVLASARSAVDGVVVSGAEWFNGDDARVYSLTGGRFQRFYTIWVRSDGKVLQVQSDERGD